MITASPPLRIACIGLGWVATHRHIPAILRQPQFRLIGVIDRNRERAQQCAARFNVKNFDTADDLKNVAWLSDVDALCIGTSPLAHAALTLEALRLGKHVLVEKPFAMDVKEGDAMVAAAAANKRVLGVVHNFQFSRATQKLEYDLAHNRLGPTRRLAAVQFGNPLRRLPHWYPELPLGLFYDESPHFFYLLRRLAGSDLKLRHGHATGAHDKTSTPSLLNLLYKTDGDIPVTIDCQFDSAVSEWFVVVTGTKAVGILDIFRDIYIRLPNDGAHNILQILRTSFYAFSQHWSQHIPNGLAYLRGRLDYGNDEVFNRFATAIHTGLPLEGIGVANALEVLKYQHEAIEKIRHNLL